VETVVQSQPDHVLAQNDNAVFNQMSPTKKGRKKSVFGLVLYILDFLVNKKYTLNLL
jgi:hypothetical protein